MEAIPYADQPRAPHTAPGGSAAALARFEAALVRVQHPLAGALRPGRDQREIRALTAAAGIALSDDAVELWSWRDGVDPGFTEAPRARGSESFPGGAFFLSLEEALRDYRWTVDNFPFTDLDDWSTSWFPAFVYKHGDTIYLDCSGPAVGPTPVQYRALKDYNWPEDRQRRRIGSLAEAVDVWTALLDRGLWAVDPRSNGYDLIGDVDPDLPVAWLLG